MKAIVVAIFLPFECDCALCSFVLYKEFSYDANPDNLLQRYKNSGAKAPDESPSIIAYPEWSITQCGSPKDENACVWSCTDQTSWIRKGRIWMETNLILSCLLNNELIQKKSKCFPWWILSTQGYKDFYLMKEPQPFWIFWIFQIPSMQKMYCSEKTAFLFATCRFLDTLHLKGPNVVVDFSSFCVEN